MRRTLTGTFDLSMIWLLTASPAQAVDKVWVDNGNQAWPTSFNWTPSGEPGPLDTAIFNLGNVTPPYYVLFINPQFQAINAVTDRLRIDSNPITFTVAASTLTIDSTNITETGRGLVIGRNVGSPGVPYAQLDSVLSQLNSVYATLGADAGSNGTLNINGGAFNVTGTSAQFALIVGLNGGGVLNSIGGYPVDVAGNTVLGRNAGSSGFANVGGGSTWSNGGSLSVGYAGQGTFNIATGGVVQTDLPGTLGDQAGAIGDVNVSGTGSIWNLTPVASGPGYELTIGRFGSGTLDISGGGDVSMPGDSVLGHQPGSNGNATIDGPGSQWIQGSQIHVGYDGTGSIGISNGALLQTTYGYIGGYPGSSPVSGGAGTGSVNVSGANSHWKTTSGWISLGSGVPGIGGSGSLTITSAGRVSTTDVGIGNSFDSIGHVSVSGANSLLQVTPGPPGSGADGLVIVGLQGHGMLHISGGGEVDVASGGSGTIGWHANASGEAIVEGAPSIWDIDGPLVVGENGEGTLDITNAANVSNGDGSIGDQSGSTGEVAVDGAGSQWTNAGDLTVGNAGAGSLSITNGGRVDSFDSRIGQLAGSTGTVTVDGAAGGTKSLWDLDGELIVGGNGNGTLQITAGAEVYTLAGCIIGGWGPAGDGSVTVDGGYEFGVSELTVRDLLDVGSVGQGTLTISDGAYVQVLFQISGLPPLQAETNIGVHGLVNVIDGLMSTGTLTVDGQLHISGGSVDVLVLPFGDGGDSQIVGNVTVENLGAIYIEDELRISAFGSSATLTILNGGIASGGLVKVGAIGAGHAGSVTVDGAGSLFSGGSMDVGVDGTGEITITNGGTAMSPNLMVGANGEINGDGNVVGTLVNGGLVSPGMSAAAIHVEGDYTQAADGELVIELASASSYDKLLVTDDTTLDGTLTVNLIDSFVPSPGQTFTIITADDVDGTFTTVNAPRGMEVTYTATAVILEVPGPICPADITGDNTVNVDDLLAVINGWGQPGNSDVNGDGTTNVDDLLAVISAWGACP